jgi:hypothetical protein
MSDSKSELNTARQATQEELKQSALKHYDELAMKACSWMNVIPKAIEAYYSEQVCEWTFCSALQVWQTECKITANLYLTVEHEYCLGCGKKIKIKESE